MNILVVGGTGPSGPYLVEGLLERGHSVTLLHRGVHEPDGLPEVPHIHADPHFAEPMAEALGGRTFDAVYCLYGRLGVLAKVFAHRCERLIGVGGRAVYAGYVDPTTAVPAGMRINAGEDSPLADPQAMRDAKAGKFLAKMIEAEDTLMSLHRAGAYRATLMRYTYIYGPRANGSVEWSIVKRLLDGRAFVNLPASGLVTYSRCAARNAAEYLLLALERDAACGEIFNCADEAQYSLGQWVELIANCMGGKLDIVDVPTVLRWTVSHFLLYAGNAADIALTDIAKAKALLGYRDRIQPVDQLAEMVAWLRRHPVRWQDDPAFPDRFDYTLEDDVNRALDALRQRFEARRPPIEVVHTYAHPKTPSLQADDRGR